MPKPTVPLKPILLSTALALCSCHAGIPGEEDDDEPLQGPCGVERWSVKTGTDAAASQVDMTPQDTTIAALGALQAPAGLAPGSPRFAGTAETQTWRLTNVTLAQYKLESDSDYHLVITDTAGHSMIAEIPAPSCVSGGPWASQIAAARAAFDAKFTAGPFFQTANAPVTITGAGFFDLLHGQTGVAPNGIELHAILSICFIGSAISGCSATPDFSLAANPASVAPAPGAAGVTSISVAGSNGFAGTVSLTATGLPAGASSSFSAANVAAGGSSNLTLSPGSAAAGTYAVTVSGSSGTITHALQIPWTISGGGGGGVVANGDFETGSLSGWTSSGRTGVVSNGAHGGTYAARVGSTSPSADSSLSQQIALPAGNPRLTFWYQVHCPDSLIFDWARVTVAGTTTVTALARTCSNDGRWHSATADLSSLAGQTVTLSLKNHDDGFPGDATYTLFDDVQIAGGATAPDFSLSLSSAAVSSAGAASAADTVTVTPSNGFGGAVALSVGGVPAGASAAFSPASLAGGGSSTLTLSPGTAAAGTYPLTVSGTGGNHTHTAALSWTLSSAGPGTLQTVFIILMENHNWSAIAGSASAPYINGTLLPQASHALQYQNPPGIHPSLPNYLWLEAGTSFGVLNDNPPGSNHQGTQQHLVTLLQNSGISWRSYQEGISGSDCPLTATGLYAPKHNPMVYFDDVTNGLNPASSNCIAHVRPYPQLAADLQANQVARYNFITPDLCNDMHNSTGCATSDPVKNGDTWLSQNVPAILGSAAFRNDGALFITWDESEGGDVPIGMIVLSPKAKGNGYSNTIAYTHSSTLRTMQEIFGVGPLLGGAAGATDLSDLFSSFP